MKTKKERIVDHSLSDLTEALGFSEEDVKELKNRILIASSTIFSKSQIVEELAEEFPEDPIANIYIGMILFQLWMFLESKTR